MMMRSVCIRGSAWDAAALAGLAELLDLNLRRRPGSAPPHGLQSTLSLARRTVLPMAELLCRHGGSAQRCRGGAPGPGPAAPGRRAQRAITNPCMQTSSKPWARRRAGTWGGLRGADAAALVEVVEHLDPSPLRRLGGALLAGLRPALLLVTTPNREYNALLAALGCALLPGRLRNSDHRFEWCAGRAVARPSARRAGGPRPACFASALASWHSRLVSVSSIDALVLASGSLSTSGNRHSTSSCRNRSPG